MNDVNEHLIRISAGKIAIEEGLQIGDDLTVLVDGTITKVEDTDNNDGTINRTYVIKGVIAEVIQDGKAKQEESDNHRQAY